MKNEEIKEKILESLKWRYATKTFDKEKEVNDEDIKTILETARLSPSSYGIEMWKFLVIKNKGLQEELKNVSYDQPQIADSSCLIVITQRTDAELNLTKELIDRTSKIKNVDISELNGFKSMVENAVSQKLGNGTLDSWVKLQTYIPLGIMIETASLLNIDTCPMEGFESEKVDGILNLKEKNLKSVAILAVGYRDSSSLVSPTKVRRNFDDVVEFI